MGVFLIVVGLITGMPGSHILGGNDSSQNLEIWTWYDLDDIRDNLAGNHTLMNDLDSTTPGYASLAGPTANEGEGWQSIGYSTPVVSCGAAYVIDYGLTGTFDGQGHEIRDLFINSPDTPSALFGYLGEGGIVRNVGAVNVTVVGYNWVGSLVGLNEGGTIENCYSTGNVAGHAAVGGLVGRNEFGNISECYSTGVVSGESSTGIGGLVGQQHPACTISRCYSTCSVAAGSDFGSGDVGGLVGENAGTVIGSFWDIETSGQSTSAGGTGMNTTQMQDIVTFSGVGWNIIAVALNETNSSYIWNIVNNVTYPFLSWQGV
jgi:hypothetical protein